MTTGLGRVPNDKVAIQADAERTETIARAEPVIAQVWSTFLICAHHVPLRIKALFLLAIVIIIVGEALKVEEPPTLSAHAKPLPLLLMMTEKPARQNSP